MITFILIYCLWVYTYSQCVRFERIPNKVWSFIHPLIKNIVGFAYWYSSSMEFVHHTIVLLNLLKRITMLVLCRATKCSMCYNNNLPFTFMYRCSYLPMVGISNYQYNLGVKGQDQIKTKSVIRLITWTPLSFLRPRVFIYGTMIVYGV